MLKSVFTVDNDRVHIHATAVDGPRYLVGLAIAAVLLSVTLAVLWKGGWWETGLIHYSALFSAALGIGLLIIAATFWPGGKIVMDRVTRQVMVDRGAVTGRRLPLEKVRFEICEIRSWTNISHRSSWAFVVHLPGESDMQLFLSVDRDKIKQLWQELGEWLAAGGGD